jgi:hypothetical protein
MGLGIAGIARDRGLEAADDSARLLVEQHRDLDVIGQRSTARVASRASRATSAAGRFHAAGLGAS